MSSQIGKTRNKEIFDLCNLYKKYENLIENISTSFKENFEYIGYLIENDLMQKWAISIFYEDLKNNLPNGFKNSEKLIEEKCKKNGYYEMTVSQTKFQNIKDLKDNLSNNKEYKLITNELWENICKTNAKKENGIPFFISKNIISLVFNLNDKLDFKIDKFVINKSTLIENKTSLNNKEKEKNGDDEKNKNNKNSKIDNKNDDDPLRNSNITPGSNQFQNEKMILIKLFLFQKELNQKIDNGSELNNEIFSQLYLISKSWFDEFKAVFLYKDIKDANTNAPHPAFFNLSGQLFHSLHGLCKPCFRILFAPARMWELAVISPCHCF